MFKTVLRQTFVEWAGLTVRYSFWAQAYYQQQEARGKPHNTIVRALAFKWIRIIFRCWKDHKPYDESKYLEALRRRHSTLLKFASNTWIRGSGPPQGVLLCVFLWCAILFENLSFGHVICPICEAVKRRLFIYKNLIIENKRLLIFEKTGRNNVLVAFFQPIK